MRIFRDITYATAGSAVLLLDLYLPDQATGPAGYPLVVWIHGGA
jgi:carboxylesterase type B